MGGAEKFSAHWQRAVRLGRWSREVSSAVENRPLLPPIQVVQPENFSFIKRKEEQVSQNPSSRRGPHRAASQGMFRDFGEPGPSSGAGGAYGGPAQTPTSGQQVRAPRRLGVPRGQRLGRRGQLPHALGWGREHE